MPAAVLKTWNDDIRRARQKCVDGCKRSRRMIDQRKQGCIAVARNGQQTGLQRSDHPERILRILDRGHDLRSALHHPDGIEAEDRNHRRTTVDESTGNSREERPPAKRQQRFGPPHAARFTGGKNDRCRCSLQQRAKSSSAKIDFESRPPVASGSRRTAIISAATEMAISSGESAPISRPMGA